MARPRLPGDTEARLPIEDRLRSAAIEWGAAFGMPTPYTEILTEAAEEIGRLSTLLENAPSQEDSRLMAAAPTMYAALKRIAEAPAWGAPDRFDVTPDEVRKLAREAMPHE